MKRLSVATCACLFFVASACSVFGNGTDELHIGVALTTGEHSKDSSSHTTTITVARNSIVWETTSSGREREMSPVPKKFRLLPADRGNLLK